MMACGRRVSGGEFKTGVSEVFRALLSWFAGAAGAAADEVGLGVWCLLLRTRLGGAVRMTRRRHVLPPRPAPVIAISGFSHHLTSTWHLTGMRHEAMADTRRGRGSEEMDNAGRVRSLCSVYGVCPPCTESMLRVRSLFSLTRRSLEKRTDTTGIPRGGVSRDCRGRHSGLRLDWNACPTRLSPWEAFLG